MTGMPKQCKICRHWYAMPGRETGLCGVRDSIDLEPVETLAGESCKRWRFKAGPSTTLLKKESFNQKPIWGLPAL